MTPPLAALRTFELVARTLSFKRAAAELGLSPTAVSHQIRKLEDALGEAVFERRVRQVELTPKGRELAEAVAPAFETIQQAVEKFTRPGRRAMVTLAAGPLFTSRWLVPRLDAFWTAFPDIDLRLQHSPLPVYRQLTDVDLAIAWGDGDWTGMQADLLLRVEVSPVLAPDLAPEGFSLWNPADVLQLPLLHQRSTAPWREWLGAAGVEAAGADLEGQIFEDANILMQAVLARKGAGLGVVPFVAGDLDAGRLIQPWPLAVDPGDAYYLVSPRRARLPAAVSAVRDWLRSQAQG